MKSIVKDLPALFCPLIPEGSFLEELALYIPRIHLHLPITTSRFSLPTFVSSLTTQALALHLHFCFSWHCSQLWEDWDVGPTHPCPPPTPQSPACAGSHLSPSSCPVPGAPGARLALGSDEAKPHKRCLFCSIPQNVFSASSLHSYSGSGWEFRASSAAELWCHHGLGDLELALALESRDWPLPKVINSSERRITQGKVVLTALPQEHRSPMAQEQERCPAEKNPAATQQEPTQPMAIDCI